MVDELTQDLAALGCEVHVISPYYNKVTTDLLKQTLTNNFQNNKGESGYLMADDIRWIQNINQWVGTERCEVGLHEGTINGVHLVHFNLL